MSVLRRFDITGVLREIAIQSGMLQEGKAGPSVITRVLKEAEAGTSVADHATTFRHRLAGYILTHEGEIQECFRYTDSLLPAHVAYFGRSDAQTKKDVETIVEEETITPGVITPHMLQYMPVLRQWVAKISAAVHELLRDTKEWKEGNAQSISYRLMETHHIVQRMLMYSMDPQYIPVGNLESTSVSTQLILWMSTSVAARCIQLLNKEVPQFPQALQSILSKKVRQTYALGKDEESFLFNVNQQQTYVAKAQSYAALVRKVERTIPALNEMHWPEQSLGEFQYEGTGTWHEQPNANGECASYQWAKKPSLLGEGYKFGSEGEAASDDALFYYVLDDFNVCPVLAPYAGVDWEAMPGGSRELLTSMIASGRARVRNFLRGHPVLASRLPYIGHIQMSVQDEDTLALVYENGMKKAIEEALSPKLPHSHRSDGKRDFFLLGLHARTVLEEQNADEDEDSSSISSLLHEKFGHCMSYHELEKMLLHLGICFSPAVGSHIKITNPANGVMTTIQDRLNRGKNNDVDAFMAKSILKQVGITSEQEQQLKEYLRGKKSISKKRGKTPQTAA
jgi:predicted RNA binding protein YcfA (HicA-like mRNA interferase family)